MSIDGSSESAPRSLGGSGNGTSPVSETVLRQALRIFEPVVRLLMSHGVTYPQLAEALKSVFIKASLRGAASPARMTDSKIAVATGIHRKDVKRLRSDASASQAARSDTRPSLVSTVFTHWLADSRYCDASGKPKVLSRQGNGDQGFEALVRKISTDVHPRTVLNELIRLNLVEADEDTVRLRVDSFVPSADFAQLLDYLGANLHDHAAAAVGNVLGSEGPYLEQSVFSSTIAPWAIDELAGAVREQWSGVVKKLVPEIAAREIGAQDDGASPVTGGSEASTARIRLGMYFYAERGASDAGAKANPE